MSPRFARLDSPFGSAQGRLRRLFPHRLASFRQSQGRNREHNLCSPLIFWIVLQLLAGTGLHSVAGFTQLQRKPFPLEADTG